MALKGRARRKEDGLLSSERGRGCQRVLREAERKGGKKRTLLNHTRNCRLRMSRSCCTAIGHHSHLFRDLNGGPGSRSQNLDNQSGETHFCNFCNPSYLLALHGALLGRRKRWKCRSHRRLKGGRRSGRWGCQGLWHCGATWWALWVIGVV